MTRTPLHHAVLLMMAALASTGAMAQATAPTLTPPPQRITDQAISTDQQTYETTQARLKAINHGGRPIRDYHLSKAQCWLDVSFHEYNRNDRGPFPQDALNEADKLARGMETGQPPLGLDTPLVSGALRLRPDLWALTDSLKRHQGFRCAQQKIACAEVELVHAGHEELQGGWRHAKPYVQLAEDLISEGQALAERCIPPAPPPPPPAPPAPPPPPPPPPVIKAAPVAPQPVTLGASVVFNFDRHTAQDMRPFSVAQLQALVAQARAQGLVVQSLTLTGHADRLNGTGHRDYNQRLSERRAATVRQALIELGLPGVATAKVEVSAAGDAKPVQACDGHFATKAQLEECLLPNRRVELVVTAMPAKP